MFHRNDVWYFWPLLLWFILVITQKSASTSDANTSASQETSKELSTNEENYFVSINEDTKEETARGI
jgi:hypothetical protein